MPVRLVSEKAWHSAFMHNMFVRASEEDLRGHVPEYTILHAPNLRAIPNQDGTNSGVFVVLSLDRGLVIIGGTHYAGEIKKAIFTIMNHILPAKGLLPMHCSANTDGTNSALFSDCLGLEKLLSPQILIGLWWGMMNMDGLKRECSTSKEDATLS